MGKRSRKKKDSLVDADTVIDLDAQREARRRQLREAAAESRRRRGVPDNDRSGYDYYGDPAGTRTSVLEEEKTADGEIKGEQRTGQKKKRLTPVRIAVIAADRFDRSRVFDLEYRLAENRRERETQPD